MLQYKCPEAALSKAVQTVAKSDLGPVSSMGLEHLCVTDKAI